MVLLLHILYPRYENYENVLNQNLYIKMLLKNKSGIYPRNYNIGWLDTFSLIKLRKCLNFDLKLYSEKKNLVLAVFVE